MLTANFPILEIPSRGKRLAYLDNAATTQKPQSVIDATAHYYREQNANVHRGAYWLSQEATALFDQTRVQLANWINAESSDEVIFTKGCTESINLVAHSWGMNNLSQGDVILVSRMEHHANFVPWQQVSIAKGASIVEIPITDLGEIDLEAYQNLLTGRVKMVAIVHVSNSIGTINPIKKMIAMAHKVGAKVMVDGAQALAHLKVDVQDLGVDFYAISGHKMYGPTGVGALYGKRELLDAMPPYQTGGSMIRTVSFEETTFAALPDKFEPGTPNIGGIIPWASAITFLEGQNLLEVAAQEANLAQVLEKQIEQINGIRVVGKAAHRAGIVSILADWTHAHDLGTILDSEGVAVRTGHHCCMPLMKRFNIVATTRASFGIYNTMEDVDQCVAAVQKAKRIFG
ncbi:MAG: SufS family cysteine desulfurase [Armatimonadetes bacterium]|nr:SufS family cysteine desulfurase [Armatimonadota bacterium]